MPTLGECTKSAMDDFSSPPPQLRHIADICNNLKPESLQHSLPLPSLFCRSLSRCHVINVAKRRRGDQNPGALIRFAPLQKTGAEWGAACDKQNQFSSLSLSLSRTYFRYSSGSYGIEESSRVELSRPLVCMSLTRRKRIYSVLHLQQSERSLLSESRFAREACTMDCCGFRSKISAAGSFVAL
ncbi:hypothetical protein TNCV_4597921 [Trichonephila clavipes]|nr:hypothetical protein TNCV_4597921 [Trichonephila clavipes]